MMELNGDLDLSVVEIVEVDGPYPPNRGGGSTTGSPSPSSCLTLEMLGQIKRQLYSELREDMRLEMEQFKAGLVERSDLEKAQLLEELAALKRELKKDRESRREQENYFIEGIDRLIQEIPVIQAKVIALEGKVGVATAENQEEVEEGEGEGNPPQSSCESLPPPQDVQPDRDLEENNAGNGEAYPNVADDNDNGTAAGGGVEDVGSSNGSSDTIHGKAPWPGHFYEFACLCGAEFLSEAALLSHLDQQRYVNRWVEATVPKRANNCVPGRTTFTGPTTAAPSFTTRRTARNKGRRSSVGRSHAHGRDLSRPLECYCGKTFSTKDGCSRHVRRATKKNDYVCQFCEQGFPFPSSLKKHLRRRHHIEMTLLAAVNNENNRPLTSTPRSGATTTLRKGKRHGRDPLEKCKCVCGKLFENNAFLYDHLRYFGVGVKTSKLLSCKYCLKKFGYANLLKSHLKVMHQQGLRLDSKVLPKGFKNEIVEEIQPPPGGLNDSSAAAATEPRREGGGQEESNDDDDIQILPGTPIYCYCRDYEDGDMVACDNQKCPMEWFHYRCVGITSPPKGKFYCRQCQPRSAAFEVRGRLRPRLD